MRTTLTLADDVAALLRRALKRRGGTMKGIVNDALRRGLAEMVDERGTPSHPFRTREMSLRPLVTDVDDIADALARAEGEFYR